MRTPENLLRHEIIGLDVEVVDSNNKRNIGINGQVVDETQHTIVIEQNNKEKRLFKKPIKLIFTLGSKKVEVQGALLEGRPWDRIKKKV